MSWFFFALVATASAVVIVSVCYPAIGMPVAWPLIAIGLLVIFFHYALGLKIKAVIQ